MAVWCAGPRMHQAQAKLTGTAAVVAVGVLAASWIGSSPEADEQSATLLEGLTGAVADMGFYG